MKIFAILLFSFELLASSWSIGECANAKEKGASIQAVVQPNFCAVLFLEECNEEEREGKSTLPLSILLYTFKSLLFVNESGSIYLPLRSKLNLFDTHPPLYQLNQTFLI